MPVLPYIVHFGFIAQFHLFFFKTMIELTVLQFELLECETLSDSLESLFECYVLEDSMGRSRTNF